MIHSMPSLGSGSISVAYFISPHGFGHASRASAVMDALHKRNSNITFHLFTTVPRWFFCEVLSGNWTYHPSRCDVGLAQKSALQEDVDATLIELEKFMTLRGSAVSQLVQDVLTLNCKIIISDIAPLGLEVAHQSGLPSVLIENFTWDWIYAGYPNHIKKFQPFIDMLAATIDLATIHIKTRPYCASGRADLITTPVSREPRNPRLLTRKKLQIPDEQKTILVTMGGIPGNWEISRLKKGHRDTVFIVPGGADAPGYDGNLLLLPHHHEFFHPDLVAACDGVIGKVGYSTIAEVFWAGIPFAYISRNAFRESDPLVKFIAEEMPGLEITQAEFEDGTWQDSIGSLCDFPSTVRSGKNGADQIADYLISSQIG